MNIFLLFELLNSFFFLSFRNVYVFCCSSCIGLSFVSCLNRKSIFGLSQILFFNFHSYLLAIFSTHNNRFRCLGGTWSKVINYKFTDDLRIYTWHITFSLSRCFFFFFLISVHIYWILCNSMVSFLFLFCTPLCYPTQMFIYLHKPSESTAFRDFISIYIHAPFKPKKKTCMSNNAFFNLYHLSDFLFCFFLPYITLHNDGQK